MSSGGPPETSLDLHKLRQFVAAAGAPSLRVAAAELYVTQQGLSAALRQLEADTGIRLFNRQGKTLELTAAGRELYKHAPSILAAGRSAVESARRVDRGTCGPFVIGHSPAISSLEVYDLIAPVVQANPDQRFTVRQLYPRVLREGLLAGDIDLALRRGVSSPLDLASEVLVYHVLRAAVCSEHPLADRPVIDAAELADYSIVVWAPAGRSHYTDFLLSYCRRHGFDPAVIVNPVQGTPPFTAVAFDSRACAFVTDTPGKLYGDRVHVIDFVNPPRVPVHGLWLQHAESSIQNQIIESARARRDLP